MALGKALDMSVTVMSHSKFRQKDTKLSRTMPVIADEFHLFGGHGAAGWTKLDRLAASLKAPLILCSATPNYNDIERCYCIQHVLDPNSVAGGYINFIYQHCVTEQNPFGRTPIVKEFLRYKDATEYLLSLPYVVYVEDNVHVDIVDIPIKSRVPDEFEEYGLNHRTRRIIASQMEERWQRMFLSLVDQSGTLLPEIYDELTYIAGNASTPVLFYCDSSQVAEALGRSCKKHKVSYRVLTGSTTPKAKAEALAEFKAGKLDALIGTATLATGTDGLDKVCDTMVIVNDTTDAALRRQLVGRILPRGADADASNKQVYRLVVDNSLL